jgi:AcrR family transcriptional regulator
MSVAPVADGGDRALPSRQADRRRRIVRAAYEMLHDSGGRNVQIRDVAERAGVALGTAYRYFGTKDRLFAEAHEHWVHQHERRLTDDAATTSTNLDRVRHLALGWLDAFLADPEFVRVGRDLRSSDDPAIVESLRRTDAVSVTAYRAALAGTPPEDADTVGMLLTSLGLTLFEAVRRKVMTRPQARERLSRAIDIVLLFRDDESPSPD